MTDREALIIAISVIAYASGRIEGVHGEAHPYIEKELKRLMEHLGVRRGK